MNKFTLVAYCLAIVCVAIALLELVLRNGNNWKVIALSAAVAAAALALLGEVYKRRSAANISKA